MAESASGFDFGANAKPTENKDGAQVNSPVEEGMKTNEPAKPVDTEDKPAQKTYAEDTDKPYTDRRSVTILPVKAYSLYRKVNDKVLPKQVNYIGSSYKSSQVLSSNRGEVEAYFPSILGIAANNDMFVTRVKQYLNNIQVAVDELGKKLDTSFVYDKKSDYYRYKEKEERIESIYQSADRSNIKKLREALTEKIIALNDLEGSKYQVGHPLNFDDYFLYRHCLFYADVAKDVAFINTDRNIRFYFKDDAKEADKLRKFSLEKIKAKENYLKCFADAELFDAVFIQYCVVNNLPILSSLALETLEKQERLDKFSTENPDKFNRIVTNKDCKLIGNIEKLIARGELIRISNTQNVTTVDGGFIGSNMTEVIAWFKNPDNAQFVNVYMNKLKA